MNEDGICKMEQDEQDLIDNELDDEIHRMEQEEPPRPHPGLTYQLNFA